MQLAEGYRLVPRPLRLELQELQKIKLPAILHWGMNHFVVLTKASRSRVWIHDPAAGRRQYSYKELSKFFSGVALELVPSDSFVARNEQNSLKFLICGGDCQSYGETLRNFSCCRWSYSVSLYPCLSIHKYLLMMSW